MKRLDAYWSDLNPLALLLTPLALVFCAVALVRRALYARRWLPAYRAPAPVVVVGNITVGGSGKTPLVIWLAGFLKALGWRPGIVSRGYGGRAAHWPQPVDPGSDPAEVGDEPVLIARRTGCPLWVGPDRPAAVRGLLNASDCDLILSDDGLQHYALQRDLEIIVIDGARRFGNGLCLPAGPLREPKRRLRSTPLRLVKGLAGAGEWAMALGEIRVINLAHAANWRELCDFTGEQVHAVAGIADPKGFFDLLEGRGLKLFRHPFPDHHRFTRQEINPADELPVLMTEKDAVKCGAYLNARHWAVRVEAEPAPAFVEALTQHLRGLKNG